MANSTPPYLGCEIGTIWLFFFRAVRWRPKTSRTTRSWFDPHCDCDLRFDLFYTWSNGSQTSLLGYLLQVDPILAPLRNPPIGPSFHPPLSNSTAIHIPFVLITMNDDIHYVFSCRIPFLRESKPNSISYWLWSHWFPLQNFCNAAGYQTLEFTWKSWIPSKSNRYFNKSSAHVHSLYCS